MIKKLTPAAVAIALLAPMTSAMADANSYCTNGLSLNFCGSIEVTAIPTSDGGTNVLFKVINTGNGVPLAAFTAVGIMVLANGINATSVYVNPAAETDTTTTPEPATLALFATGLVGLGRPVSRWRRRRGS